MIAAINPTVAAAFVAAGVSIATTLGAKLWLDRRAHEADLEADYRHVQRKALLELIGRYHGGLVEHATSWNYRMLNLFANADEGWLRVDGGTQPARATTSIQRSTAFSHC